jgi:hypothetical protein
MPASKQTLVNQPPVAAEEVAVLPPETVGFETVEDVPDNDEVA